MTVLGHEVTYDAGRGLWFCDIQINAGRTYTPFVRLALARFQPDARPGLELSPVVLSDFVQLAPDRDVAVAPDTADPANRFNVKVSGPTYRKSRSDAIVPVSIFDAPGTVIELSLQARVPNGDDVTGWTTPADPVLAQPQRLTATLASDGTGTWTGQVTLPAGHAAGQFRLAIKEFERLPVDAPPPEPPKHHPPHPPQPPHPSGPLPPPKHNGDSDPGTIDWDPFLIGERLVFAETFVVLETTTGKFQSQVEAGGAMPARPALL